MSKLVAYTHETIVNLTIEHLKEYYSNIALSKGWENDGIIEEVCKSLEIYLSGTDFDSDLSSESSDL